MAISVQLSAHKLVTISPIKLSECSPTAEALIIFLPTCWKMIETAKMGTRRGGLGGHSYDRSVPLIALALHIQYS